MKSWMIAAGVAMMALPGLVSGEMAGATKGHASPQSTCSTGESCKSWNTACCPQRCCGTWELEGQALYWRHCADNKPYALRITGATDQTFAFQTVKPDNDWGFRLKGQYTDCSGCKFASLSYLYFDESSRATALPAGGVLQNFYFGSSLDSVSARVKAEYHRLVGRLGHYICSGCRGGFYGYGGISWIYLRGHERVDALSSGDRDFLDQRGTFSAAGFEAGVGGHYSVWCGFGLGAELGGIAAVGEQEFKFNYRQNVLNVQFAYPSVTTCIPGALVKLEAFYERCWCGFNWGLMIGYEHHYYWTPLLVNRLFDGDSQQGALTTQELKDFGAGGLFFGARVGY